MKSEQNRRNAPAAPTCWQREAPCACLRIETSAQSAHLFRYQHLVTASLRFKDKTETLRILFSTHDVEIAGRNLRQLLLALQDYAVKWVRALPERYQLLQDASEGVVISIRINEAP